jgi:hypothetical protein
VRGSSPASPVSHAERVSSDPARPADRRSPRSDSIKTTDRSHRIEGFHPATDSLFGRTPSEITTSDSLATSDGQRRFNPATDSLFKGPAADSIETCDSTTTRDGQSRFDSVTDSQFGRPAADSIKTVDSITTIDGTHWETDSLVVLTPGEIVNVSALVTEDHQQLDDPSRSETRETVPCRAIGMGRQMESVRRYLTVPLTTIP